MIFSKKKTIIAYTIEKCSKCGMQRKREFNDGDCLFSESSKCKGFMFKEQGEAVTWFCPSCNLKFRTK